MNYDKILGSVSIIKEAGGIILSLAAINNAYTLFTIKSST